MIYLDYNATTPIDSAVRQAMLPFISSYYGNPSSDHIQGRIAREAVEKARGQVAGLLQAQPDEICFTSGGSEANNAAIKGVAWHDRARGPRIITSAIEHPSVLQVCAWLEQQGFDIVRLPVDTTGRVCPDDLEAAMTDQTILVSIMHANNEVGTIQPIRQLAAISHRFGALFHTDAAQSVGKIPTDVGELGVDLLSVAGHKLYAPKGIGALFIRRGIGIEPLIHGAGHERGLRAGTENVIGDVALGEACAIAARQVGNPALANLTASLWGQLKDGLADQVMLNGHSTERLPNTLNVSFSGWNGQELLSRMPEIAASTGSACHAGETTVSPVLQAMGLPVARSRGAVRFSLGRMTSPEEVDQVAARVVSLVRARPTPAARP